MPSREDRAKAALVDLLSLWESDRLPAAIAQTVIHRLESDAPSTDWSLGNQLIMIMSGTDDARGFKQWNAVGRTVKKGAKAVYILAPRSKKITERNEKGQQEEKYICTGFLGIPVFRYEDTEGEEIVRPDYRPAELPPLHGIAERLGYNVRYAPFTKNYLGYCNSGMVKEVVLCSHEMRVFFHELAHAAHGSIEDLYSGQNPRQEIIAETVSAVLCKLYGIEGYERRTIDYIRRYANGESPAQAVAKHLGDVQKVLDVILSEARLAEQEEVVA